MAEGKALAESAYRKGAECERRSLIKTWAACVLGSAVAFGLVVGIREWRSLIITSLGAGSVGVVLTVLVGRG